MRGCLQRMAVTCSKREGTTVRCWRHSFTNDDLLITEVCIYIPKISFGGIGFLGGIVYAFCRWFAEKGTYMTCRERRSIRIWRDNWIPYGDGRPISLQGRCLLRRISELLDDHGVWRTDLLCRTFLPADVHEILKIRTSSCLGDDFPSLCSRAKQRLHGVECV